MEGVVAYDICLKLLYVTKQGFYKPVSDCAHILSFSLHMLNKDESISKLIFGICICGAKYI